jgi:hypothetical protein
MHFTLDGFDFKHRQAVGVVHRGVMPRSRSGFQHRFTLECTGHHQFSSHMPNALSKSSR